MNPFNFYFNPSQPQEPHPFNPLNPNFAQNITQTVQNAINQSLTPLNALFGSGLAQPQPHPIQSIFPLIQINNGTSVGNFFGGFFAGPNPIDLTINTGNNMGGVTQASFQGAPNVNVNYSFTIDQRGGVQSQPQEQQIRKENPKSDKDVKSKAKEGEKSCVDTNSGQFYKKIGNEYYNKGLYAQAVENYTRAIEQDDTQGIFYANRARCYKHLGDLKKAYEDAKTAVELDDANVKAHLLCGQILAEIGKVEQGLEKLNKAMERMKKALELCQKQEKKEFEKDLKRNIAKVKKVIWLKHENIKKQKKAETLKYVKELINRDSELNDNKAKEQKYQDVSGVVETTDIMENPVLLPSGISYEKEVLDEHLERAGKFDPVTREPVDERHIHPNLTIKHAIEKFLEENPWAFELKENESYLDIKF